MNVAAAMSMTEPAIKLVHLPIGVGVNKMARSTAKPNIERKTPTITPGLSGFFVVGEFFIVFTPIFHVNLKN